MSCGFPSIKRLGLPAPTFLSIPSLSASLDVGVPDIDPSMASPKVKRLGLPAPTFLSIPSLSASIPIPSPPCPLD